MARSCRRLLYRVTIYDSISTATITACRCLFQLSVTVGPLMVQLDVTFKEEATAYLDFWMATRARQTTFAWV